MAVAPRISPMYQLFLGYLFHVKKLKLGEAKMYLHVKDSKATRVGK
jgi:hypothetical protein